MQPQMPTLAADTRLLKFYFLTIGTNRLAEWLEKVGTCPALPPRSMEKLGDGNDAARPTI